MIKDTVILFNPMPWEKGNKKARVPYSLLFLERNIRDLGLNIVLVDEFVDRDFEAILQKYQDRLLIAGVSTMTGSQLVGAISFSKAAKQISGVPVVWGGWHPTILPEQTLESNLVDLIVIGQGEVPFRELLEALKNQTEINTIPGLGYKKNGEIIVNPRAKYQDPFTFPRIDYTKIDINKYIYKNIFAERSIRYITTQGCPYKCGFCSLALVYERKWYHKTVKEIIEELEYFIKVGNIDGMKFDDDNFFVNRNFVIELCTEMIKRNLNLKWFTQGHASHLLKHFSEEDMAIISKSGAKMISIGAESGDQVVLDLIAKNNKVEDNIACSRLFHKFGINTFYTVMVCFPINPERDYYATLHLLMDAKLIDPKFRTLLSFFTPYPGTDLYEFALKSGYVPPQSLIEWSEHTYKRVRMPWVDKRLYYESWRFVEFYLPLADPELYKKARWFFRPIVFLLRVLFYDLIRWRFKNKNLKYPIEANVVLYSLRIINKVFGLNLKLRNSIEGFLD
ncbi:MAG: B12-binding domain-containing radical SAM protein [Bacteroidetes bacterium]|nr:B12-binding domain-containing radical SAM protein [Bacteroidota bacterium]